MHRTQIYLTDEQRLRIKRLAVDTASTQAAVIRRILDEALGVDDGERTRLAAVDATAGLLRDAPDWPEWLADVRGRDADARLGVLGLWPSCSTRPSSSRIYEASPLPPGSCAAQSSKAQPRRACCRESRSKVGCAPTNVPLSRDFSQLSGWKP